MLKTTIKKIAPALFVASMLMSSCGEKKETVTELKTKQAELKTQLSEISSKISKLC
jgi:outer membrane lipoprotein-sorting protein